MLGAYTFWDAMWTMIVFFAWIMFITWVIMLMIDNFRRKDHGGGAKAGWARELGLGKPRVSGVAEAKAKTDWSCEAKEHHCNKSVFSKCAGWKC